jgi:hypothetical protein
MKVDLPINCKNSLSSFLPASGHLKNVLWVAVVCGYLQATENHCFKKSRMTFRAPQRPLGSQGLVTSAQGLGCMGMTAFYGGDFDRAAHEETSLQTIGRALELGVNFLDTAWVYQVDILLLSFLIFAVLWCWWRKFHE